MWIEIVILRSLRWYLKITFSICIVNVIYGDHIRQIWSNRKISITASILSLNDSSTFAGYRYIKIKKKILNTIQEHLAVNCFEKLKCAFLEDRRIFVQVFCLVWFLKRNVRNQYIFLPILQIIYVWYQNW